MRPKASGIDDSNRKGERREKKGCSERMRISMKSFQGDLLIRNWVWRVTGLIRKRGKLI